MTDTPDTPPVGQISDTADEIDEAAAGDLPQLASAEPSVAGLRGAAAQVGPSGDVQEASVSRSSLVMAVGTMVSRVLGLLRQSLLTMVVGVSLAADAFQVANTLPNYVFILLSAGVLNAVLIPQITKAMRRPDGGQEYVDRLLTASMAMIVVVTVLATAMSPLIVSWTSDLRGTAHHLAVFMAFICLPQIAFYGLYTVVSQVLNARGQYAAVMWAPGLSNVVQIAGLVWFLAQWHMQPDPSVWTPAMVWVLAGTFTLGIVVQGVVLLVPLARGGFRWTLRWGVRGYGFGEAASIVKWTFIALLIAQLTGLFLTRVMTHVRSLPGNGHVVSVAAQGYAFLIFMLPHSLITVSILTAIFPRLSRAMQSDDLRGVRRLIHQGLTMPAVGIIPASVVLSVLAEPAVAVLMPGLSHQESHDVGLVLTAMASGLIFFGIATLQQRYCFAREDGKLNLVLQSLLSGTQVIFGLIALAVPAEWAVFTVAMGQTIGNLVCAVAFLAVARRQVGGLNYARVVRLYVRLLLASLVAGIACWATMALLRGIHYGWLQQLLTLGLAGIVFIVVFLGGARALHIREVGDLLAPVLRRLRRA